MERAHTVFSIESAAQPVFRQSARANRRLRARSHQRGAGLIEFVLCFALFWCPFFFGMWKIGMGLIRAIQVAEVCRDAAHMAAHGIDFSQPGNQTVLQTVAQGIPLSASGTAVVILSTVTSVTSSDCPAGQSSCVNTGKEVFTRRIVIGNATVRSSAFDMPSKNCLAAPDGTGNIPQSTYMNDATCVAQGFAALLPWSAEQYAFLAEMTVNSPDLGATYSSSARSIF